jgi:hypothetical protein
MMEYFGLSKTTPEERLREIELRHVERMKAGDGQSPCPRSRSHRRRRKKFGFGQPPAGASFGSSSRWSDRRR